MSEILHRIGTQAAPSDVYRALTTLDGLAGWWTVDTSGDPADTIRFRFGDVGGFDMKVVDRQPDERVVWEVVDGPDEWLGTTITFDLRREDNWTIVLFTHEGWRERSDFQHHCSTKWATFLMSLKAFVESGAGEPHPHDVRISNWH
jgi:uncharacterized protein YndB with AHSA1/START domain